MLDQAAKFIKQIERGIFTLTPEDEDRMIAALRAATTQEQVDALHAELLRLDPPLNW